MKNVLKMMLNCKFGFKIWADCWVSCDNFSSFDKLFLVFVEFTCFNSE